MSFRGLSFKHGGRAVAVLLCLGSCGVVLAADPARRGRPIEFSNVGNEASLTNLNPLSFKSTSERRLPDLYAKPLSLNSDGGSLGGFMAPPPSGGAMMRSRQARGESDLDNNWVFMTPDDMIQSYMAQEILNLPASESMGMRMVPGSALEQFLQRTPRKRDTTKDSQPFSLFSLGKTADNLVDPTSGRNPDALANFGERQSPLNGLLRNGLDNSRSGFPDLLQKPQNYDLSPEAVRDRQAQAAHIEEFKQLLGFQPSSPATVLDSLANPPASTGAAGGARNPYAPYSPSISPNPFGPQSAVAGSSLLQAPTAPTAPLAPTAPMPPSATDFSSLSPASTYSPPAAMPHVDFTAPRRAF